PMAASRLALLPVLLAAAVLGGCRPAAAAPTAVPAPPAASSPPPPRPPLTPAPAGLPAQRTAGCRPARSAATKPCDAARVRRRSAVAGGCHPLLDRPVGGARHGSASWRGCLVWTES